MNHMNINYCNAHKQPNQKSKQLNSLSGHDEKLETAAGSRRSKSNTKTPRVKKEKNRVIFSLERGIIRL
jgi:hypothetical protein